MPRKRTNFVAEKQKKETNRINNKCFLLISLLQIVPYPYIDEANLVSQAA